MPQGPCEREKVHLNGRKRVKKKCERKEKERKRKSTWAIERRERENKKGKEPLSQHCPVFLLRQKGKKICKVNKMFLVQPMKIKRLLHFVNPDILVFHLPFFVSLSFFFPVILSVKNWARWVKESFERGKKCWTADTKNESFGAEKLSRLCFVRQPKMSHKSRRFLVATFSNNVLVKGKSNFFCLQESH